MEPSEAALWHAARGILKVTVFGVDPDDSEVFASALRAFQMSLELDPKEPANWETLLMLSVFSAGDWSPALRHAEDYVRQLPSGHSYLILAKVLDKLGRDSEAARNVEEGLKLDPKNFDLRLSKVALALLQDDPDAPK
jgi:tetratricopeptide (TPR) repeat protein